MKLNNNYRIENQNLMVEVEVEGKDSFVDINNLPVRLKAWIVYTNAALLQYLRQPSEFLKSCIAGRSSSSLSC
jgi:hypothetical protein